MDMRDVTPFPKWVSCGNIFQKLVQLAQNGGRGLPLTIHSRPQSLRSLWPAAGIESSGSNHFRHAP